LRDARNLGEELLGKLDTIRKVRLVVSTVAWRHVIFWPRYPV